MRNSLFSVNDHYPNLARSVRQIYEQFIRLFELAAPWLRQFLVSVTRLGEEKAAWAR